MLDAERRGLSAVRRRLGYSRQAVLRARCDHPVAERWWWVVTSSSPTKRSLGCSITDLLDHDGVTTCASYTWAAVHYYELGRRDHAPFGEPDKARRLPVVDALDLLGYKDRD